MARELYARGRKFLRHYEEIIRGVFSCFMAPSYDSSSDFGYYDVGTAQIIRSLKYLYASLSPRENREICDVFSALRDAR